MSCSAWGLGPGAWSGRGSHSPPRRCREKYRGPLGAWARPLSPWLGRDSCSGWGSCDPGNRQNRLEGPREDPPLIGVMTAWLLVGHSSFCALQSFLGQLWSQSAQETRGRSSSGHLLIAGGDTSSPTAVWGSHHLRPWGQGRSARGAACSLPRRGRRVRGERGLGAATECPHSTAACQAPGSWAVQAPQVPPQAAASSFAATTGPAEPCSLSPQ